MNMKGVFTNHKHENELILVMIRLLLNFLSKALSDEPKSIS